MCAIPNLETKSTHSTNLPQSSLNKMARNSCWSFASWKQWIATKRIREFSLHLAQICIPWEALAWASVYEPVDNFLNEKDEKKQKELTEAWVKTAISQLDVIIITVRPFLFNPSRFLRRTCFSSFTEFGSQQRNRLSY